MSTDLRCASPANGHTVFAMNLPVTRLANPLAPHAPGGSLPVASSVRRTAMRTHALFTHTLVSLGLVAAGLIAVAPALADTLRIGNVATAFGPKDGPGSGSGSWIGYTAGNNQATGTNSAVAAGSFNLAAGVGSFVGAGTSNQALGTSSLVIGGFDNRATSIDSLVGAGAGNRASGLRAVVIGGGYNLASGGFSFIGGGGRDGSASTVAGTNVLDHVAMAKWSTIGGGVGNRAGSSAAQTGATVAGGEKNQASNTDATVIGGTLNVASGTYAFIGGGQGNAAAGSGAAIAGGLGNSAAGLAASVPGGNFNAATGDYSVAAGRRAKANHSGSFVFGDSSNFDFASTAANQFSVRAVGGTRIVSAVDGGGTPTAGVTLAAGGGAWASLSDRNAKQDLVAVDAQDVLTRLAALPLYTWRYKTEVSKALHMGPTAQDFHAAFGLGESERTITTVDADGVALAAVQALHRNLQQQDATLAAQDAEYARLASRMASLESTQQDLAVVKAALAKLLKERSSAGTPVTFVH
jgi:hypothetical protein